MTSTQQPEPPKAARARYGRFDRIEDLLAAPDAIVADESAIGHVREGVKVADGSIANA